MSKADDTYELVGIQFAPRDGIAPTWLPLMNGLNVLYGVNGAGKTQLMSRLRQFFAGGKSNDRLHLRSRLLTDACLAVDPSDKAELVNAANAALSELFGRGFQLGPDLRLTETLQLALSAGCLYLSSPDSGLEVGLAIPLDGSVTEVDSLVRVLEEQHSKLVRMTNDLPESEHELSPADHYAILQLDWRAAEGFTGPNLDYVINFFVEPVTEMSLSNFPLVFRDGGADADRLALMSLGVAVNRFHFNHVLELSEGLPLQAVIAAEIHRRVRSRQDTDDHLQPSADQFTRAAEELGVEIQKIYDSLLLGAPRLRLGDVGPIESLTNARYQLQVEVPATQTGNRMTATTTCIGLEQLSRAQLFWAKASVQLATLIARRDSEQIKHPEFESRYGPSGKVLDRITLQFLPSPRFDPAMVLIDEPELGLHRTAETYLANGLLELARRHRLCVIAATHSPGLINLPNANIIEAHREMDGLTYLSSLDTPTRGSAAALGLEPSDLLRGIRSFILVEGEHDKIVLERCIGNELSRLGAVMVPIRGGKDLDHIFASHFFTNYTDAQIVGVLDNVQSSEARDAWRLAKEAYAKISDTPTARSNQHYAACDAALESLLTTLPDRKGKPENRYLREYYMAAITNHQESRTSFVGLSKPDIIMYLDPSEFGLTEPWTSLHVEFTKRRGQPNVPNNFKDWLRVKRNADFNLPLVRAAADKLAASGDTPDDFLQIVITSR